MGSSPEVGTSTQVLTSKSYRICLAIIIGDILAEVVWARMRTFLGLRRPMTRQIKLMKIKGRWSKEGRIRLFVWREAKWQSRTSDRVTELRVIMEISRRQAAVNRLAIIKQQALISRDKLRRTLSTRVSSHQSSNWPTRARAKGASTIFSIRCKVIKPNQMITKMVMYNNGSHMVLKGNMDRRRLMERMGHMGSMVLTARVVDQLPMAKAVCLPSSLRILPSR